MLTLNSESLSLAEEISALCASAGGTAYAVGGAVRDALLGIPSKDMDIEVFGLPAEKLRELLKTRFEIAEVGASFGVFKIRGSEVDVALPRRERKTGRGHKGFAVEGDPDMSIEEAAQRRDFTLNALYWDLERKQLIDPYGGQADLKKRLLRHTSEQFAEDPLRVLRAMQFIARFELHPAPETLALCRTIEPEDLPRERIFEEWKKLLLKGVRISSGLAFLRDCGWLRYFPELQALDGCPQDPKWHPEGDVFIHTALCLDAYARQRTSDEWEDLVVGLAVLCHDFGKPATTFEEDGRIKSPAHESVGEDPARTFLGRLTEQRNLIEDVIPLVRDHMTPSHLYKGDAGDSAVRRLARRVGRIDRLVRVVRADRGGMGGRDRPTDDCAWLLERAEALAVKDARPEPIVMGRHLIDLGERPGPHFGVVLDACYEAQLEGDFSTLEEGLALARKLLAAQKT